jgi:hypothetical protein
MRDERGEAVRWLRQAENDLEFGKLALREGYFAQAAESLTKRGSNGVCDRICHTDGSSCIAARNRK